MRNVYVFFVPNLRDDDFSFHVSVIAVGHTIVLKFASLVISVSKGAIHIYESTREGLGFEQVPTGRSFIDGMRQRTLVGPSNGIAKINGNFGRLERGLGRIETAIDNRDLNNLGLSSNSKYRQKYGACNGWGRETHVDRVKSLAW